MSLRLSRSFRAAKVPEVTLGFWTVKLLSTAMGEATSDFLVHRFNPELAVLVTAVVFVAVLWQQLRAPRYETLTYWAAVVMVSVFGTMCADVLHVAFGVPYVVSATAFAVVLAGVFFSWSRVEGTLAMHSITTTRRELFYWAAITSTFALGTALGDLTATTVGWGFLVSGVVFAVLFSVAATTYGLGRVNVVASFWCAYVLTRPLGASFADYLGVSHARGGRNWGPGNVSMLFSLFIVVAVAVLYWRERASGARRSR